MSKNISNDSVLGPGLPEKGWVPAPRYLLRRHRILHLLGDSEPGTLLEIGCGAGTLLYELTALGFECEALETSESALEIANEINEERVRIHSTPRGEWVDKFDYLLAFEVLEHIDDDRKALNEWFSWLNSGGLMLLSVPAHMKKWGATDVWAGHYRRYERPDLLHLISSVGFIVERAENYGFPLANLIDPLRNIVHARQLKIRRNNKNDDRKRNNDNSGIDRGVETRLYPLLSSLPGRWVMQLAYSLQGLTVERDWGTGYLVAARKP